MRYVTIGSYQVSFLLLTAILVLSPVALAVSYYLWASRTIHVSVEEPLSIVDYPSSIHSHPGENETMNLTIMNAATANYSVTLAFTLNDTVFQESYVTFSNYTYHITPSTNHIMAWMLVDKKAHPTLLDLTVDFYRE